MKKILFLMPLMAISLLVNCGGKDNPTYSIGVSAFGCSTEGLKENYTRDEEANLKFIAQDNFFLPQEIKVKINDTILTKDVDYQYVVDEDYLNADFKIKVTDNVEVTISAYDITTPLTFTSNKDNATLSVHHTCIHKFDAPTNLKYIHKDSSGQEKSTGSLSITDTEDAEKTIEIEKSINKGDTIQLFGDNPYGFNKMGTSSSELSVTSFVTGSSDDFSVSGNIMSLISETNFVKLDSLPGPGCFGALFYPFNFEQIELSDVCNITDASLLYLPYASSLSYAFLFSGCATLKKAPIVLPAMDLYFATYAGIFNRCSSLEDVPELPAIKLDDFCYFAMFNDCTSIKKAPNNLPAKKIGLETYGTMFSGCTALTTPPRISALEGNYDCCAHMFEGCTSLYVTKNPDSAQLFFTCPKSNFGVESMFDQCPGDFTSSDPQPGDMCYYKVQA
ncbi:MAG: hypothetical protein MJ208_03810 [Bacilli bacterium]|nr:hypothetical protein [Bacilli bacterium]